MDNNVIHLHILLYKAAFPQQLNNMYNNNEL